MKLEGIELTDEQAKKLEEIARREKLSIAEIVARAVDELLDAQRRKRDELWTRSLEIVGKYDFGVRDLAERHDDYLEEEYSK